MSGETADDEFESQRKVGLPEAGVVVVFANGAPTLQARGTLQRPLIIGRATSSGLDIADERASREHTEVRHDGERWIVRDLKSHNGTYLDGHRVVDTVTSESARVLRLGQTLLLLDADVRRFRRPHRLDDPQVVVGPAMRDALEQIAHAASLGDHCLIIGESGTGKEHAARSYHARGMFAKGPFVGVNCATIPHGIAERLLFGAKRGAYSGAVADVVGYLQSAQNGVLFLDEVGELDLDVQAKLLRVLETREVMPLGASTPRAIDLRVVAATNRDLRAAISEGKFRADLYFRLAQQEVLLPPLRQRPEELPWLAALEIRRASPTLKASAKLIEACLLRNWPGNVRELLAEMRRAAHKAIAASAQTVGVELLSANAGAAFGVASETTDHARGSVPAPAPIAKDDPMRETILASLKLHGGNVAAVSRTLGLHRTQLYRLMKKLGIEG